MRMRIGFSLIECMAYFALIMLLATIVFGWLAMAQTRLTRVGNCCNQLVQLHSALDVFSRDIAMATAQKSAWEQGEDSLLFYTNQQAINWYHKRGLLIRRCGNYDATNDMWQASSQGVVADDITQVRFFIEQSEDGTIAWVSLALTAVVRGEQTYMQRVATVRNRTIS